MTKIKQLATTGLAVAAVAGIAIAASAAANGEQQDAKTPVGAALGGPDPTTPATPSETPAPPRSTPGEAPAPPRSTPGKAVLPSQPKEEPLPKDAVKACKELLANAAENPGRKAKPVARLDGEPGSILIFADSNYWAGCDTAYARTNGQGSLREPAKLGKPAATVGTFAVANNLLSMQGKEYEYYWAAGQLPAGVAKIAYTFPDGVTANAVVHGNYWLMQYRESKPWVEGADANRPKIKVTLQRPNGSVLKEFRLTWGDDTCAQITHGC